MADEKETVIESASDPKQTTAAQADKEKAPVVEAEVEDFPDPDEDDLDDLDGKHYQLIAAVE